VNVVISIFMGSRLPFLGLCTRLEIYSTLRSMSRSTGVPV